MKLIIRLKYHTNFGEKIFLCGDASWCGSGQQEKALPLFYRDQEFWQAEVILPDGKANAAPVSYYFFVQRADGSTREDFGGGRTLEPDALKTETLVVCDTWNDPGAVENIFCTEPFQEVFFPRAATAKNNRSATSVTHTFCLKAPLLSPSQVPCLLGGGAALGNWKTTNPVLLRPMAGACGYRASLNLEGQITPLEYKYGIFDLKQKNVIYYEDGSNRILKEPAAAGVHTWLNDGFLRHALELWRGAGVAIPVFSLRSEHGCGVGEFSDLPRLGEWASQVGLRLIQILPVNDTSATHGWMDSYPYNSISAFALHPLYLNLDALAKKEDQTDKFLPEIAAEKSRLNALPEVDYEAVMAVKLKFLRQFFTAQSHVVFAQPDYNAFFAENKKWLLPYAAFCHLRDKFGTADFSQWQTFAVYRETLSQQLADKDPHARREMEFHCFIQFHLHQQLRAAVEQLHAMGIILKGDIAIGVSAQGADVWQEPELFHAEMQTGAPPDPFAEKGQNWGFPTYNWPRMTEDGFAWWKRRFQQMGHYFDAFRIDHVLGFFRIWSIPQTAVEGILGWFVPAQPVTAEELAGRGLALDRERLTEPWITKEVVKEIFGASASQVEKEFLQKKGGCLILRKEFRTQRLVEKYFQTRPNSPAEERLKLGLYELISNVLLLEDPSGEGQKFHVRFGLEKTSSFRALDSAHQTRLKELALDYFFRRQDRGWEREGAPKLAALKRVTNMLICGEDLGLVPECVPHVMKDLGLVALEIQRMPKVMHKSFSRPADAAYLTVVTPSTHDMSTIRGWWTEDRALTQLFYESELGQTGPAPLICSAQINQEIVRQHLASPALWSIFQIQDLLGMDEALRRPEVEAERINVPAIPRYYWRYRMHLSLEHLVKETAFNRCLKEMIKTSGRTS